LSAILVVRPSSLGDIVYALSLVADVRAARPELAIDWVAEEAFFDLPAMCSDVRRVVPLALRRWKRAPLRPAHWRELSGLRTLLREERYEAILDLQEQVKGGFVASLAQGTRHGFDRASIREPVATLFDDVHHAVPRGLHFAARCRMLAGRALGYEPEGAPRWRFAPPPPDAALSARPYVVAVHATSRATKLWPEERWRALLKGFAQAGLAVLVPWGSDAERERSGRLASDVDGASVPPRQPLAAMAGLLARAELAVGVDTGLTHLAAALGTPTIALFTVTDPAGAGVAVAGGHARDLGGNGEVPSLDDARQAAGALLRAAPRC
jgi:heptosyltransferase-1